MNQKLLIVILSLCIFLLLASAAASAETPDDSTGLNEKASASTEINMDDTDSSVMSPADPEGAAGPVVTLSTDSFDAEKLLVLKDGLKRGMPLDIPFSYAGTDELPVISAELFYRTDTMKEYSSRKTTYFPIHDKWHAFLENEILLNAKYVDFYVSMSNAGNSTTTEVDRVYIKNEDNNQSGLKISFNNDEVKEAAYSGIVQISAKDLDSTRPVSFTLDGASKKAAPVMDEEVYFTFEYQGVDKYFKNGLTTGGDAENTGTVLGTFSRCSITPANGSLAIPVEAQYFTYNSDGSVSIKLTLRAGTFGSCREAYTAANNDDFTVSNMKLILADGSAILPDKCTGEIVNDRTKKEVSSNEVVRMGDSKNCCISIQMDFTITSDRKISTANSFALDTNEIPDGKHTLTVGYGKNNRKSVSFSVNNGKSEAEADAAPELSVPITLNDSGAMAVEAVDNGVAVELCRADIIDKFNVLKGAGDSTYFAASDFNESEVESSTVAPSTKGQYEYQILEIPAANMDMLRLEISAESDYGKNVQLYVLNRSSDKWELLNVRSDGSNLTAVCPVGAGYTEKNVVKVLIQARTTAYTPYTYPDKFNSVAGDNQSWDGSVSTLTNPGGAPDSYDFAVAWFSDPQLYSVRYPQHYKNIIDWIVSQKDELGIEYVLNTGDLVNDFEEEREWAFAREQQDKLTEAGIPNGVLAGNHDVAHGQMVYDLYWRYFGEKFYKDKSWYGSSYKNNLGHYDILEKDGEELLIIYISWDIYTQETDWINSVLAAHPDTKAIIATHCGITGSGEQSYSSDILLENVCKNNPDVIAILSGHYHGAAVNFTELTADSGEKHIVYQICTDYQSAEEGGLGYIKMLYFDLTNDRVYINSYSPSVNDLNYFDNNSLLNYSGGAYKGSNLDRVILPLIFDREKEKKLTVSNVKITGLTSEIAGTGKMAAAGAQLKIKNIMSGDSLYAKIKDPSGRIIAYSKIVTKG